MKISEIAHLPTTVQAHEEYPTHESILRSYQILERVKAWLSWDVPSDVILELIGEMEANQ